MAIHGATARVLPVSPDEQDLHADGTAVSETLLTPIRAAVKEVLG